MDLRKQGAVGKVLDGKDSMAATVARSGWGLADFCVTHDRKVMVVLMLSVASLKLPFQQRNKYMDKTSCQTMISRVLPWLL